MTKNKDVKPLKIAFAGPWNNIHPALQHTLFADLVLSNQYEALVSFYANGTYGPMAAKEWTQSSDFRKITFKIDTSRKFSDGINLSAKHFKDSWETALKLDPVSTNKSALDVLYKVEGYNNFEKTGKLSGVKAIDDETLELHFVTPFRMALEHLSGARFSAFRESNGKFLGTGVFVIEELSKEHLLLKPNPYHAEKYENSVEIFMVPSNEALQALSDGKIDVLAFGIGSSFPDNLDSYENISPLIGQDALHRAIYMHSGKNRLFEKKEFRQALQYLSMQYFKENKNALGNPNFANIDPQIYLPLQAGRLEQKEVEEIINNGKKYVDELRKAAKLNPPVLLSTEEYSIRPMLEALGIAVSPESKIVSKPEIIAAIYKGDVDLIHVSFSVTSGDPDGMYHVLGEQGGIKSPLVFNKIVSDLLEDGRKITAREDIDKFYKKVTSAILEQVPLVHLGFNKSIALYRNDKVNITQHILRRNTGHVHLFKAK